MMKSFKVLIFFISVTSLWARPWQNLLNTEPVSIQVSPLEFIDLNNQIRVYYKQNSRLPKVTMQLIVEGGVAEEIQDNAGISNLWGNSVVFSGSKEYPRDKLSQILEMRGSEFGFDSSLERSVFSLDSLSEYFKSDLKMIMEVIRNPVFVEEDVMLLKSQTLQSIKKRTENPAGMAYLSAQLILWKDNIRGLISTEKSIKSLNPAKLREWHKRMMKQDRFTVLVTGDIQISEMKKILETELNFLEKSTVPYRADSLIIQPENLKSGDEVVYHLSKDIPQTTILFRAPGINHASKDYFALKLFDFLLGGDSFNSYLTKIIRVKNGWSYSVYSNYTTGPDTGSLSIFAQTQNKNVIPLIKEVKNILKNPELFITREKLDAAKNSLKNSFVFLAETPEKLAGLQLSLKWDRLPENYLNVFLDEINKVEEKDLIRIAKTYYNPDKFFITVVGPEKVLSEGANSGVLNNVVKYQIPE